MTLARFLDINKSFAGNSVLRGVSLELNGGEVVAIIGGNGAGKSTLMKILSGIYQPDSGKIFVNGGEVGLSSPSVAHANGIYLVPQEAMLFPNMTVSENIALGFDEPRAMVVARARELADKLGWKLSFSRKANTLSIAEQQLVEILRGLLRNSKILILDEPTSALTFGEIESLFKLIADLCAGGVGIFYITHRLHEVFEIADRVAVLRDGEITLDGQTQQFTKEDLINGLLPAGAVQKKTHTKQITKTQVSAPVLELENLRGYGFRDINLKVYPGEILGIAGVVGAGRTELAEAVCGIGEVLGGRALLNGRAISGLSLNYVPEDRALNGIFAAASVRKNITAMVLRALGRVFLSPRGEREISLSFIDDFRIKITGQDQTARSLSGGNQQKLVLSRVLSTKPSLVILDEPTRGIDAAAREDVYSLINGLRGEGLAVLLISSDMEEIEALCDRAVTMYNGTLNMSFGGAGEPPASIDNLMSGAFGVKPKC